MATQYTAPWNQPAVQPVERDPNQKMFNGYPVTQVVSGPTAKNPNRAYWRGGADGKQWLGWVDEGEPKEPQQRFGNKPRPAPYPTQTQPQSFTPQPLDLTPVMSMLTQQQTQIDKIERVVLDIITKVGGKPPGPIAPPSNQNINEKAKMYEETEDFNGLTLDQLRGIHEH